MKLSQEEIKFIDTYLVNNDVVYVDIRQEMLDHIASAVEQRMTTFNLTFYDAFKSYMAIHKREIMKNNKRRWSFSWPVLKQFLLFLIRPYMVVLAALLGFFFVSVDANQFFSPHFTFNHLIFVSIMTLSLFQLGYFYIYLKKRFYTIEKTGMILAVIYYAQIFFLPIYGKDHVSGVTMTVFTYLIFGYILFFILEIVKFNKHHFNYI
ncbi:hypothetical protein [Flavobacterium sp. XGLA_31]|uniref:hypothetical protein n=1 Tax=Flavobacterium sp. XGLA_31 TaxID=3447666 RepID=UPI003F3DAC0F